jgi:hypothetical protein
MVLQILVGASRLTLLLAVEPCVGLVTAFLDRSEGPSDSNLPENSAEKMMVISVKWLRVGLSKEASADWMRA